MAKKELPQSALERYLALNKQRVQLEKDKKWDAATDVLDEMTEIFLTLTPAEQARAGKAR